MLYNVIENGDQMDWVKAIYAAIIYMEEHLTEDITLNDIMADIRQSKAGRTDNHDLFQGKFVLIP